MTFITLTGITKGKFGVIQLNRKLEVRDDMSENFCGWVAESIGPAINGSFDTNIGLLSHRVGILQTGPFIDIILTPSARENCPRS